MVPRNVCAAWRIVPMQISRSAETHLLGRGCTVACTPSGGFAPLRREQGDRCCHRARFRVAHPLNSPSDAVRDGVEGWDYSAVAGLLQPAPLAPAEPD